MNSALLNGVDRLARLTHVAAKICPGPVRIAARGKITMLESSVRYLPVDEHQEELREPSR